jgi:broad specificity phosphatase PhoE
MARTAPPSLLRAEEKRIRVLHWIRHGQYNTQDVKVSHLLEGDLTERGRQQARQAGQALKHWPISRIYTSDLLRAVQTAEILGSEMGGLPIRRDPRMRECVPTRIPGTRIPPSVHVEAQESLQGILAHYFRPVRVTRHELFVAHGNLIRALACKVLGTRKTAWMRMRVHHLSLTRFIVRPTGEIVLLDYNTLGHLPPELIGEM